MSNLLTTWVPTHFKYRKTEMVANRINSNMTKIYDFNILYKASWFQSLLELLWYSDSSYPNYYCVLKAPVTIGNFLFTIDSSVGQKYVGPFYDLATFGATFLWWFESNTNLKQYSCDVLIENMLGSKNRDEISWKEGVYSNFPSSTWRVPWY